jgi:hypothetical protein
MKMGKGRYKNLKITSTPGPLLLEEKGEPVGF